MATLSLHLPIVIDIPAPCAEVWGDMIGGDRQRHCGVCDKQIHNLSVLTEAQIAELVLRRTDVCVSLEARADGTLVHAERPPTRGRARGHAGRVVMTAALTALAACGSDHVVGKALPAHPAETTSATPGPIALTPASTASAIPAGSGTASPSMVASPPATGDAPQRMMGAPLPADPPPPPPPPVHKVGKMMRVPNDL